MDVRALIQQTLLSLRWTLSTPVVIVGWTLLCGLWYSLNRIIDSESINDLRLIMCFLIFVLWLIPTGVLLLMFAFETSATLALWLNPVLTIVFIQLVLTVRDMIRQFRDLRA